MASEFVLIRCADDAVWVLRNGLFTHHTVARKRSRRISDPSEIEQLAREVFLLPGAPVREGMAALETLMQRRYS